MNEPAPKGTIHLVDEDTQKLHQRVAPNVQQITGQPVLPQSLNPKDESPLGKITEEFGNATRYTGVHLKEAVHGRSETDRVDTVSSGGKLPISITAIRALKKGILGKAA